MAIKNKVLAALAVIAVLSTSIAVAKTQEECVAAAESCYDTWYIPNWGCDVLYKQCRATWT